MHQNALKLFGGLLLLLVVLIVVAVCLPGVIEGKRRRAANLQVVRIADKLDKQTSASGAYERVQPGGIKELDPWGGPIDVSYSQGGVAEIVHVRSAGPDRQLHTHDDVYAERMSTNLKGVGEGIKQHAGEVAESVAKGAVKGAITGVKEAIQESLPRRKKPQPADEAAAEEARAEEARAEE